MIDEKKPTISDTFIARRIAEFPTLYAHGDEVIYRNVIGNQGGCKWDKNGLLVMTDQHYNNKTKKWTKYPLQIPMKTAYRLVYSHGDFIRPYYDMSGPINRMPVNINDDWLMTISIFLNKWGNWSMDDFKTLATLQCMLYYSAMKTNPNAGLPNRTINDFQKFHDMIPKWKAMVNGIYYQKQYNKIDPKVYLGIDI